MPSTETVSVLTEPNASALAPSTESAFVQGAGFDPLEPLRYQVDFEHDEPDQDETTQGLSETLLKISDQTYKDSGKALRSVHAKSHGLLYGEMTVFALPPNYAHGILAEPRTYPVLIRLSTSPGDELDDRVSTPRGMAIKILDVTGDRLAGTSELASQDLLMVDAPAFLTPTGKKFLGSLKLLAATTDKAPLLKRAFSAVARAAEEVVEAAGSQSGTLTSLGGHPLTDPLGQTFYSQTPYLHGPFMAKWSCAPIAPELTALTGRKIDLGGRPNGLREEVNAYFEQFGAEWELRVQLNVDLDKMPIEDASVEWPEELSPYMPVARIKVAPQTAWSEERSQLFDDGLSFSPWHGLSAHRPLGSINRMRRVAYQASVDTRSPRGRCPVHDASTMGAAYQAVPTSI